MKGKEYKIYRDTEGNLTIDGKYKSVVFTVTAKTKEIAEEALRQLQQFEKREGMKVDKLN